MTPRSNGTDPRRLVRQAVTTALPPVRRLIHERDVLRAEVERLRRRVAKLERGRSRREGYRYVFVMAYGRSGSTLLQAILNSTPGVLIRGENHALPYHLHQFQQSAVKDAAWAGDAARRKVHPFFGIRDYPADLATTRMRELLLDAVLRPEPDTKVLGFKEIRWYQEDLPEYLAFMRQVFPGARFILNTRRLEDAAKSSWWADRPDAYERLVEVERMMFAAADGLGDAVFHLRYDDYAGEPERLRELFSWLDLPFDEARVRKVMERRYAQIPGGTTQA